MSDDFFTTLAEATHATETKAVQYGKPRPYFTEAGMDFDLLRDASVAYVKSSLNRDALQLIHGDDPDHLIAWGTALYLRGIALGMELADAPD